MTTRLKAIIFGSIALLATVIYGADIIKSEVVGSGFVADFYSRADLTNKRCILFLGGSEGGKPRNPYAQRLAESGYPTLALAYFKEQGLPESLEMIPLEYFDKPIEWMQERTGRGGIVVVGASRGAELALLLASTKPTIRGVIAISPSSVVWNGMPKEPPMIVCSSWSLGGKPVPFMPADLSRDLGKEISDGGLHVIYKFFQEELARKELVAKATIKVDQVHGPVLLASGHDDEIWPAEEMGDAICSRLKEKAFKYRYEHLKYPDAGHTLSETLMIGGTVEGNRKARIDLTERMLAFLKVCDSR
jgi:dienelactone hydrolase